jgi:DNA-directed RNA polymerase specialized sigma24 family protein
MVSEIYTTYHARIYAFVNKRVRDTNTTDDIVQETFIRFMAKDRDTSNTFAYLCEIAKNLIPRTIPRTKSLTSEPSGYNINYDLHCALKNLSKQEFDLVWRIYADQQSMASVARELGISVRDVKIIAAKTLRKLHDQIPLTV